MEFVKAITAIAVLGLVLPGKCLPAQAPQRDYPVKPVPFTAVHVNDVFWAPRIETNRRVTIPFAFQKDEEPKPKITLLDNQRGVVQVGQNQVVMTPAGEAVSVMTGLEMALLDTLGKTKEYTVGTLLSPVGTKPRPGVPVNAVVGARSRQHRRQHDIEVVRIISRATSISLAAGDIASARGCVQRQRSSRAGSPAAAPGETVERRPAAVRATGAVDDQDGVAPGPAERSPFSHL